MYQLFNFALVSVVVLVARYQVQAEDLCQLNTELRQDLCEYIKACNNSNRFFSILVRDKRAVINEEVFKLQDPQNVTGVDDLYQELIKYTNIFRGFNDSMIEYMSTKQYEVENSEISVANKNRIYLNTVDTHIKNIQQTTNKMSESISVTTPAITPVSVSARTPEQIYAETYYVTNKMSALLVSWLQTCTKC